MRTMRHENFFVFPSRHSVGEDAAQMYCGLDFVFEVGATPHNGVVDVSRQSLAKGLRMRKVDHYIPRSAEILSS
jgi:hypothetical protein